MIVVVVDGIYLLLGVAQLKDVLCQALIELIASLLNQPYNRLPGFE